MEPSNEVLARLDRIGALDRGGAAPGELLAELRELVRAAEALPRDGTAAAPEAVDTTEHETGEVVARLRTALARDIIG
jgi:hypothetical protein